MTHACMPYCLEFGKCVSRGSRGRASTIAARRLRTTTPVGGSTAIMRDSDDEDRAFGDDVSEVVRESTDRHAPNVEVRAEFFDPGAVARPSGQSLDGRVDL